jgi:hypothetical protein
MSLSNLSGRQLDQAIKLLQERKVLLEKLNKVKVDLLWLSDSPPSAPLPKSSVSSSIRAQKPDGRRKRRGKRQSAILEALQAAGAKGISVKELAVQIEGNEASIRTWIYTVGKKITGLQKVAPGTFAYTSNP